METSAGEDLDPTALRQLIQTICIPTTAGWLTIDDGFSSGFRKSFKPGFKQWLIVQARRGWICAGDGLYPEMGMGICESNFLGRD
jgi:hypothetical protein